MKYLKEYKIFESEQDLLDLPSSGDEPILGYILMMSDIVAVPDINKYLQTNIVDIIGLNSTQLKISYKIKTDIWHYYTSIVDQQKVEFIFGETKEEIMETPEYQEVLKQKKTKEFNL